MIKELKDGMDDGRFSFTKIDSTDGQYKIDVYKLDSKLKPIKEIETTVVLDNSGNIETTVVLDNSGNTVSVEWEVTGGGKRGTGYKKANVGEYDKGHRKSVQDGAKDNCVEDSPINIIPQSYDVNHSAMRRFEICRSKKCQGIKVITEIIDDKHVRVKIPEKGIDVIYNPKSTKSKNGLKIGLHLKI